MGNFWKLLEVRLIATVRGKLQISFHSHGCALVVASGESTSKMLRGHYILVGYTGRLHPPESRMENLSRNLTKLQVNRLIYCERKSNQSNRKGRKTGKTNSSEVIAQRLGLPLEKNWAGTLFYFTVPYR